MIDFSQFQRQSPKGILVNYGFVLSRIFRGSWVLLIILFTKQNLNYTYLFLGVMTVLIGALILAILQYVFYEFKIDNEHFILKKGFIQKSNTSIPFERIQNVHFKQNIIQQLIDVTQVEIETAGSKGAEISIKALPRNVAEALKDALFAERNAEIANLESVDIQTHEEAKPLIKLSLTDLFKVSLTENHLTSLAIVASLFSSLISQLEEILSSLKMKESWESMFEENAQLLLGSALLIFGFIIILIIVSIIVSIVKTFIIHYDLKVVLKNKAVEISQGLFTKQKFTLKKEKIQYITTATNPLKKLMGIFNVNFRQASSAQGRQQSKKQIRIVGATQEHIQSLQNLLYGLVDVSAHQKYYPHPYFRVLLMLRSSLFLLPLNGIIFLLELSTPWFLFNILFIPLILYLAKLKYDKSYYMIDNQLVVKGFGRIETHQSIFEYHKLQGVSMSQNIFQIRRDVVNLNLLTASGNIKIPYVPKERARLLYNHFLRHIEQSKKAWI
ncbi:MAG: putative membrane protein [Bacteroidia bacterium]|jgi:putative membrane protein